MGFKIINSREYREVCERVAFLESDIDEKNRELEVKDETINRLKKNIIQLEDCIEKLKSEKKHLSDLRDGAIADMDKLQQEVDRLKAEKREPITFVHDEEKKPITKKPRPARKPMPKKDK